MALGQLIIVLAFLALGWLIFIRPMRRRLVAQRELYESVSVGDEIVTQGGLLGFVRSIDEEDDTLVVEIAPGTNVRVVRRGVAAVIPPDEPAESERNSESDS